MASRTFAFSFLAFFLTVSESAAQDLNGKWFLETFPDQIIDIVDAGGAISMAFEIQGFPLTFNGTLVGSTLTLTSPFGGGSRINATTLPGNDYFDGPIFLPNFIVSRILARRCECFDGNTVDGDGCDATCRVEPCFTCTGTPSICTPTPDGGTCSDASVCTAGDTCTAGVCNGNPVTPCVDLSGIWDVTQTSSFFGTSFVDGQIIEQHENVVLFRHPTFGGPQFFGLIDPSTGDFNLATPSSVPICNGVSDTLTGTASLDGLTYAADRVSHIQFGPGITCVGATWTDTAIRQVSIQASALSRFGEIALALSLVTLAAWSVRRVYA